MPLSLEKALRAVPTEEPGPPLENSSSPGGQRAEAHTRLLGARIVPRLFRDPSRGGANMVAASRRHSGGVTRIDIPRCLLLALRCHSRRIGRAGNAARSQL